jgi:arsenical pump membrane protein
LIELILTSVIFVFTLLCILTKPFKKGEYVYTTIFSIIIVVLGLVTLKDIVYVMGNIWNAVLSLISIMIISLILDEIGFFKWAALTIVFTAEGCSKKLFLLTVLLGATISIFFNNDGTILILTPIVYEMVKEIGFKKSNMIPFLFACGFIADTASVPLVVSNLANIVNADTLNISFNYYTSKMLLPGITAIAMVTLFLYIYYEKLLRKRYEMSSISNPDLAVKDWKIFNLGILVLFFVIIGYFIGSKYGIPVSFISILGAVVLLFYSNKSGSVEYKLILKKAPWDIILFAFGMYIIVFSLYKNGFNHIIDSAYYIVEGKGKIFIALYSGILSTITACTMNNLPSVMIGAFSIKSIDLNMAHKEIISFANVIGNDVGAKLTPIGSLATILWINILKDKGVNINIKDYMVSAAYVIIPTLIISLLSLALII